MVGFERFVDEVVLGAEEMAGGVVASSFGLLRVRRGLELLDNIYTT